MRRLVVVIICLALLTPTLVSAVDLKGLTVLVVEDAALNGDYADTVAPLATDLPKYLRKGLQAKGVKVVVSRDKPYDLEARMTVELGFAYKVFTAWVTFNKATLTLVKDETEVAQYVYDIPGSGGQFKTYGRSGERYAADAGQGLAELIAADEKIAGLAREFRLHPQTAAQRQIAEPGMAARFVPDVLTNIPKLASKTNENNFAVVVGIETYRALPRSDYSGSDAVLMKEYLKASGFPERNIMLLTDGNAGLADIRKSLERWLPNQVNKNSTVVFYYSGHGAPEPSSGNGFLVPFDGDPNYLEDTAYSLKRLYEMLGKLKAKHVVAMLDSCFSGSGGRSVLAKGARPLVIVQEAQKTPDNLLVLSATQGVQISSSDPEKRHGIFTYHLLSAMREGIGDVAKIYQEIKPKVEDDARKMNVEQSPTISTAPEKVVGRFMLF
jgi:Caspase domain